MIAPRAAMMHAPIARAAKAAAGAPVASQAAPPIAGPRNEQEYMMVKMPAVNLGTSAGDASRGGSLSVSTRPSAAANPVMPAQTTNQAPGSVSSPTKAMSR